MRAGSHGTGHYNFAISIVDVNEVCSPVPGHKSDSIADDRCDDGSMRVIGAGWGRTGTTSAAAALELVGFGPCFQMQDVFRRPEFAEVWNRHRSGEYVDWRTELREFDSQLSGTSILAAGTAFSTAKTLWRHTKGTWTTSDGTVPSSV
ncbi:sulfotransferase [Spelaeicoccus albus]|uniref:Uncharacterized protein n=1 Tax=Spelaeicoccus albus TaxID=1280376 RepID=A0A7Z0IIM4_9MICO|nr:sulfotransferase [Spelaeicoccus albus]NYI68541.1 hypothetical protein [Spelaeicoccus albus]